MRCAYVFALAASSLFCTSVCTAASAPERLNQLNVAAVDAQGQPVTGLQSSDFQIQQDGKPQTIVFFRFTGDKASQTMKPGSSQGSSQGSAPDTHEYSNRATAPTRVTVILIDLLSDRLMSGAIIGEELTRALKDLETTKGLYLYILTSSGELYPVHPLPKPDTALNPSAEPSWAQNIGATLQAAFKAVFGFKVVDERDVKVRFDSTMQAMRELAVQMQLISGRRSLVWVTHGVPLNGVSISEQGRVDFTNPLRVVCEVLEHAQVVVYPVAESSSGAGAALVTESEQTLEEVANITGGRLYRSGAVADALRQSATDARGNYQLAYYTEALKTDGKHHKLRVTCSRKDVRLETEQGFYTMLAEMSPAQVEQRAITYAVHSPFDATDIGLRVSMTPDPAKTTAKTQEQRFELHIDPADLLLHQAADHRTARISLMFAVYGAEGSGQSKPAPLDLNLTAAQYESAVRDGIELHQTMPIGPTVKNVRVIVLDRDLGTAGSVTIPIEQ